MRVFWYSGTKLRVLPQTVYSLPRKPESSTRKQIPFPSCSYLSVSSGET